MKELKERVVSFETAKLAKDKGFEDVIGTGYGKSYYTYDGKLNGSVVGEISEYYRLKKEEGLDHSQAEEKNTKKPISAPTQSLLQTWLREEKSIIVNPSINFMYCGASQFTALYDKLTYDVCELIIKDKDGYFTTVSLPNCISFDIYEDALETGLQEALKLVEEQSL